MCDGSNDQLGGVSAAIVKTGAEDWKELLCEVTSSEGEDVRPGIHIVEGDFTLLVVDKHSDLLNHLAQMAVDCRVCIGLKLSSISQTNGPVTVLGDRLHFALSVDGMVHNSYIPFGFVLNLDLVVKFS